MCPRVQPPRKSRRPTSWSLLRPKRCPKKLRRLTTRLLPRRMSFWGTSWPVIRSPNGIRFAVRCTSVTCRLEWMVKWPQEGIHICGLLSKTVFSFTVFTADAAERQQFYIQQAVRKGYCVTAYLTIGSVEWLHQTPPYVEGQPQGCTNDEEGEPSLWQDWSSRNHAGICPNEVAELIQPDPPHSFQVDVCIATGLRGYWTGHDQKAEWEAQGKG